MRLRHIEVFYAVYTSGSTTHAAAMLNVSQPSVSKVLAHAEQQLGFKLFERLPGKLLPTPEAHELFKHVADVYQDLDRLRHVAKNLRSAEVGRIRIACTPAFGIELLPKTVVGFHKKYPQIVFEIETLHLDEMNDALRESRVELGLAFDPIPQPGIGHEHLASGRFVVIAPENTNFDGAESLSIAELGNQPFIGLNSRGPLGRQLSTYLNSSDVELNIVAWTETYHVAKSLVTCGAGIAIIDEITARSSSGGGVQILQLSPRLEFDIKALHLESSPLSVAANAFMSLLRKTVSDFVTTVPRI